MRKITIPGTAKSIYRREFNTDKDFLTKIELMRFRGYVADGTISIYRTERCVLCAETIPKNDKLKYCSLGCKEQHQQEEQR
jgi:hypothetical protein